MKPTFDRLRFCLFTVEEFCEASEDSLRCLPDVEESTPTEPRLFRRSFDRECLLIRCVLLRFSWGLRDFYALLPEVV